jgi:hypothetical protein
MGGAAGAAIVGVALAVAAGGEALAGGVGHGSERAGGVTRGVTRGRGAVMRRVTESGSGWAGVLRGVSAWGVRGGVVDFGGVAARRCSAAARGDVAQAGAGG